MAEEKNGWSFIARNWLIIITLCSGLISYTQLFVEVGHLKREIEDIKEYGSPSVQSVQKDVRWIMEVIACKWGLVVPKNNWDLIPQKNRDRDR